MPRPCDARSGSVARRLRAAGCLAAEEEAALLLDAAPDDSALDAWIARREDGEPLAWITGRIDFCDQSLHIEPGIYVPRPQTEELARRAAALLPTGGRALDLCTGSGAIAAHLRAANPTSFVIGVDVDVRAAACARRNGVPAVATDLDTALRDEPAFHVVTCIAPYVPTAELAYLPADVQRHEPHIALDGGAEGVAVIRRAIAAAGRLLLGGGWLLIEIGGDQDTSLSQPLATAGFDHVETWTDDEGDLRGLAAQRAPRSGGAP